MAFIYFILLDGNKLLEWNVQLSAELYKGAVISEREEKGGSSVAYAVCVHNLKYIHTCI